MPCSFIIQRMAHNLQICGATQYSLMFQYEHLKHQPTWDYIWAMYYIYIFVLYTSLKWLLYQEFNLS